VNSFRPKIFDAVTSICLSFWVLLSFFSAKPIQAEIPDQLAQVTLSSDFETVSPGASGWLITRVKVESGWHMYWKNAGQSGYPTTIEWEADGVELGPLQFPAPKAYEFLEMIIYVHEGEVVLLSEMRVDEDFDSENLEIRGKLSTLICNEENCIPYEADLILDIPLGKKSKPMAAESPFVSKAKASWPALVPADAQFSALLEEGSAVFQISHPGLSKLNISEFYFFPESEYLGHQLKQSFTLDDENGGLNFSLPVNSELNPPDKLTGVLTHPGLGSGWTIRWDIDSVKYGQGSIGQITGVSVFQPVEDDMGLAVLMLLLGMVVIAFALWLYGKGGDTRQQLTSPRTLLRIIALVVAGIGVWLAFPSKDVPGEKKIEWGVWSPELEAKLKEEGKAVYVDYTARWCASCIANKRVYTFDSMIDLFQEKEIVALRADWTDRGPVILDSLQSYGRFGVPLNVYHPPAVEGEEAGLPVLLPEILTRKNVRQAVEEGKVGEEEAELGFLAIIGFAALGGLILNLMPCVFPVIGLKVMSFVKQAGEDPAHIKKHGLIFTLGVILSFWLLVGTLLGLRETLSEDLGWGFQLQEPVFVFALAVFLLIFAMSLSGVFEIGMSLTGVGAKLTQTGGLSSSFFSGVLATVVATPCMAPFLGVAVGAALTMEWLPAFTVFTAVALGLSAPYLLLSIFPKWMSRLPKPGAWMDTFKQAMAFPLYGTVAWLLWTLQSLL
jgi:thiol:disulfide interchange protein/DsbC/DsbD-like thiol-disulfide interchange protein